MNETTLIRIVTDLAAPLAASLDLTIWGIEAAFGKRSVIRVYVEGETGVDIDKCAELSRLLGLGLDVEDTIPGAYVLEVSSPGLERTFFTPEQLAGSTGKTVAITLLDPTEAYPDRKKLTGTLTDAENGTFSVIPLDGSTGVAGAEVKTARFTWDEIKKASLVHFLPETPGTVKGKKSKQAKPLPETPADGEKHTAS